MKKEFIVNQAKFIYTKDELGYQEVLDDFINASSITIITFNISDKQKYLLDCIRKVSDKAEINIITNIPSRWEKYYSDNYRTISQKKINVYLTKLKPEDIGGKVSVFFNFDNHGKIVMTDNVVYIGSSNYSEESKLNIEFGFLVRDKDFIKYLFNEVVEDISISGNSLPYYDYNYMPLLLESNLAISTLFSLKNELYDQIYQYYDDIGGSGYYYNTDYDLLSYKTLGSIFELMHNINEIASEIYDALDRIANEDEEILDSANGYYETLIDISSEYEDLIHSDEIYKLAHFRNDDYVNELLQTDFSMEAYDENLEYYIDICADRANEKLNDLCNSAKDDLNNTLDIVSNFIDVVKELIELFQRFSLVQINPNIDNTKE